MGWPWWGSEREQLYHLGFDPIEMHNLIADPRWAEVADDLRARLHRWMIDTNDPLLEGPVPLPPGAWVNSQDQRSASDPPPGQARAA
jgi:N-sulfoglucosamine sulfohydrolase